MNAVAPLTNLPALAAEQIPAAYEGAKQALEQCQRVVECKSWSDKAEALKIYARQARDDSLRILALRIQARAERRAGELLKQIPSGSTSNLIQHRQEGNLPSVTRTQAAAEAGLSDHRRKQAMRIASLPAEDFQRQVDGDSPPSITQLAAQGTASTPTGGPHPSVNREGIEARQALLRFALFCEEHDAAAIAQAIPRQDIAGVQESVTTVDRWLDRLVAHLAGQS